MAKPNVQITSMTLIPDQSIPWFTTNANGADHTGWKFEYWVGGEKGLSIWKNKRIKEKSLGLREKTLNDRTMTGKARDGWHDAEKDGGYILLVPETKWKSSMDRILEAGFNLFYHGTVGKRKGSSLEAGACKGCSGGENSFRYSEESEARNWRCDVRMWPRRDGVMVR